MRGPLLNEKKEQQSKLTRMHCYDVLHQMGMNYGAMPWGNQTNQMNQMPGYMPSVMWTPYMGGYGPPPPQMGSYPQTEASCQKGDASYHPNLTPNLTARPAPQQPRFCTAEYHPLDITGVDITAAAYTLMRVTKTEENVVACNQQIVHQSIKLNLMQLGVK